MSYVLGFFFADGYISKNPRGSFYFCFVSTDKELIQMIKSKLKSNHKISKRNRNKKWKTSYRLQIGSKEVCKYLKNQFKLTQNKNKEIIFPDNIPNNLFKDFVRGYFDGDGGVFFKKYKNQIVFKIYFTSGNKQFLKSLHKNLKDKKVIKGGFIQKKNRGYELVLSKKDSWGLYKLMYNDVTSNMYLNRKYKIFKKAKQKIKRA